MTPIILRGVSLSGSQRENFPSLQSIITLHIAGIARHVAVRARIFRRGTLRSKIFFLVSVRLGYVK